MVKICLVIDLIRLLFVLYGMVVSTTGYHSFTLNSHRPGAKAASKDAGEGGAAVLPALASRT